MLIQINDNKAYKFLENLEDMHIIKVLEKSLKQPEKLSEKYSGKLSSEVAEDLQTFIAQGRVEWDQRSI